MKLVIEVPVCNAWDVHSLVGDIQEIRSGPFRGRVTDATAAKRVASMSPKELRKFLRAVDRLTTVLYSPLVDAALVDGGES